MENTICESKARAGKTCSLLPRVLAMLCAAASIAASAEVAGFAKTFTMTLRGAVDGSTLNDFPLAVRVAEGKVPGFSYSDSLEDGRDIRFSLEDGTELAAACDTWNPSGESVFWVLVPALAPGMTVKMHVGKAGDAGYATPSDVWSSYIGVWHLNETGAAAESIAESSANGITGTGGPNSIATADGMFGGARGTRTSGVKRPIFSTDNNAALDAGTAFTVSGWIRAAGATDWAYIASRKNTDKTEGWGIQFGGANARSSPRFYFTGEQNQCTGTGARFFLTTNEWIKFDATYNMSNVAFYANGNLLGRGISTVYEHAQHGSLGLRIGGIGTDHGTFNGDMDEIRYSSGVKSAAWISTEYANQRADSTFIEWDGAVADVVDPSDFANKISFTVKGCTASEPLVGFPVLVKLQEGLGGGFRYSDMRADGADMAFALEDRTRLPHDIDTWNTNGVSYVWVRIPALENQLVFKLHYGGAPQSRPAWWTWRDYAGVWHMNETANAGAVIAEAGENGITGTGGENSIATADGVFGGARGTRTSGVKKPIFSTIYNVALDVGTAFTVSGWIRSAGASDWAYLVSRKDTDYTEGWGFQFGGVNARISPRFYFSGERDRCTPTGGAFFLTTNEWIKFDATFNMSNVAFYANGRLLGTGRGTLYEHAEHGTLGLRVGGLTSDHGTLNGDMDEIRYVRGVRSAEWIANEYSAMHSPETFLRADYEGDGVLPPPAFEKYVPLTVSGYAGASTLTNFPVLVRVSEIAMPGFSYAKAGGREGVRFTDDEGRYLVFECDTWDPLGESLFWVSVPELSGTETRLRLYFGQNAGIPVGGNEDSYRVWSRAGYAGVFHMDVSSANKVADSCLGVQGTVLNPVESMPGATGLLGGAYVNPAWQTSSPRISLAAGDSGYGLIRAALTNAPACTFSLWVKNEGGTGAYHNDTWHPNYGHLLYHSRYNSNSQSNRFDTCLEGSPTKFSIRDAGGEFLAKNCIDLSTGWHLVTLSYAGRSRRLYFDGVENASFTSDAAGYNPNPSQTLVIGCNTEGAIDSQWVGGIDEVRFRTATTGADWMAAEIATVTNAAFVTAERARLSDPPRGMQIIFR